MAQTLFRSFGNLVVAGSVTGLLLGCHKAPPRPAAVPASVAVVAPREPNAVLPPRQPGLWETTITEQGSEDTPQTLQICIDALTDQHLGILGTDLSGDTCTGKTISQTGPAVWGLLAQCNMGTGGVDAFSGSISGDPASDYTMKMRSQTTGASLPQMNKVTTYTVASKRTGDCTKGEKPGDVMTAGTTLNLFDMAGIRTAADVASSAQSAAPDPGGE